MNQSLHTGRYFYKCPVISHNDNLTFDLITYFEVFIKRIPRMGSKLFHAQGYSLFGIIKVEYSDIKLLVKLDNFFRVVDPAP